MVFKRFGTHDEYLDGLWITLRCARRVSTCVLSPAPEWHRICLRICFRGEQHVVLIQRLFLSVSPCTTCSPSRGVLTTSADGALFIADCFTVTSRPAVTCSVTCELSDWDDEVFWPLVDEFRSRATVGLPLTWSVTPPRSRRRSIDRRVFP